MEGSSESPSSLRGVPEGHTTRLVKPINNTLTLMNIPQEARDHILSFTLPKRDFQTCSKTLCIPKIFPDDPFLEEGIDLSIRAVNHELYDQCLRYMCKNHKVYIDPDKFFITLPQHTHQEHSESFFPSEIVPLIQTIFITDKHLPTFSEYTALSRLTGVRTVYIEHDLTLTPYARVRDIKNLVRKTDDPMELFVRDTVKAEVMSLSIAELKNLQEQLWSEEERAFLGLRELLGVVVGAGKDARGLSIKVHIRCPKCQCATCVAARAGGDSTMTIVYDWVNQVVLDAFWV